MIEVNVARDIQISCCRPFPVIARMVPGGLPLGLPRLPPNGEIRSNWRSSDCYGGSSWPSVVVALAGVAAILSAVCTQCRLAARLRVNTATGPSPKVEVPEALTHDFGSMTQLWKVHIPGNSRTTATATSSCGWKAPRVRARSPSSRRKKAKKRRRSWSSPRKSNKIDLEWQTKMFHDDYQKSATIGTNDPSRRSVSLIVKGKVFPPVIVIPNEMVTFNSVSNEETHSSEDRRFSVDRPDLKITNVSTTRPEFLVAQVRPLTPEECKQLKVKAGLQVTWR